MIEIDLGGEVTTKLSSGRIVFDARTQTEEGNALLLCDGSKYLTSDHPKTVENLDPSLIEQSAKWLPTNNSLGFTPTYIQKSAVDDTLYAWDAYGIVESVDSGRTWTEKRLWNAAGHNIYAPQMGLVSNKLLTVENIGNGNDGDPRILVSDDLGKSWRVSAIEWGGINGAWTTFAISQNESILWVGGRKYWTSSTVTEDLSRSCYSTDNGVNWSSLQVSGNVIGFRGESHFVDNLTVVTAWGGSNDFYYGRYNSYWNKIAAIDAGYALKIIRDWQSNQFWFVSSNMIYKSLDTSLTNFKDYNLPVDFSSASDVCETDAGDVFIIGSGGSYQLKSGESQWQHIYVNEGIEQTIWGRFFTYEGSDIYIAENVSGNIYTCDSSVSDFLFTTPDFSSEVLGSVIKMVGDIV
ncbi:sialidase family protein [Thalassomonas actiniarum]|nr:sialidase family protein [Thalassomonas actiniarum]